MLQTNKQTNINEKEMPRYKDEPPAVRVYTVCDESRYLTVSNVPALGCGDDLLKLFSSYGAVDEFKPVDAEDCEPFTDVYWVKFLLVSNARFAKRKLDESVFMGNRLQVQYAPQFESVEDTKDKLEGRRKEVLARLNSGRLKGPKVNNPGASSGVGSVAGTSAQTVYCIGQQMNLKDVGESQSAYQINKPPPIMRVSSNEDYFPTESMNQTVRLVREKLDKIQSRAKNLQIGPAPKKARVDNRRRI